MMHLYLIICMCVCIYIYIYIFIYLFKMSLASQTRTAGTVHMTLMPVTKTAYKNRHFSFKHFILLIGHFFIKENLRKSFHSHVWVKYDGFI
jgi:hypothetical protein